jgi:hypothetical protein
MKWRSIDESPRRPRLEAFPPPPVDRSIRWMETAAIWLGSAFAHALLGFVLLMFYLEVQREPEETFSVTIWREARGRDSLRIGAPEQGPPGKGAELPPEPPKKEEAPKVEAPKPPPPAPAPSVPEAVVKAPEPVAPPPQPAPEGGAKEPIPPAVALGSGTSAGVRKSDSPELGKPAAAPDSDVTDSDIDADPSAAIRRKRGAALGSLRGGGRADIVVVTGSFDHIEEVLDRLEIPYSVIAPEELPRADLSSCKALLVNCHTFYSSTLFRMTESGPIEKEIDALEVREAALRRRLAETKEKRKVFETGLELLKVTSELSNQRGLLESVTGVSRMTENVRKFVASGGYLFTSDWGLSILERAFPGTVKNGGNVGPRSVTLRPHAGLKDPLLDEVFYAGPKSGTVVSRKLQWEVDSGSYAIRIDKTSVRVLAEMGDASKCPAVAVAFTPEKSSGKVLHILSHFQKQATTQGDYALQNLLLNFLIERAKK